MTSPTHSIDYQKLIEAATYLLFMYTAKFENIIFASKVDVCFYIFVKFCIRTLGPRTSIIYNTSRNFIKKIQSPFEIDVCFKFTGLQLGLGHHVSGIMNFGL